MAEPPVPQHRAEPAGTMSVCKECSEAIGPCPCGIWWCSGWIHSHNRDVGGSHFCYPGQPEKIADLDDWDDTYDGTNWVR